MTFKTLRPLQVGHFIDTYMLGTQKTHSSLTDPYSNSAALEGCRSSRDNPEDWSGLLIWNIWVSSIYYCSQSSFPLSLHKFFSTPSSVLTHLTLRMRAELLFFLSVTFCCFLCNCNYFFPSFPPFLCCSNEENLLHKHNEFEQKVNLCK